MKRIILLSLLLMSALVAGAQTKDDVSKKTLCFAYVSHSGETAVNSLVKYLESRYEKALETDDFVFVTYLSDGDTPLIVEVNTASDNRADFEKLIYGLKSKPLHETDPEKDLKNLVALFNRLDFVDENTNEIRYGLVDWHFHVNSGFWKLGYNESLIASLCFVMGVDHFKSDNFRLRCYFSRYDEFEIDEACPFGIRDLCSLEFNPYYY